MKCHLFYKQVIYINENFKDSAIFFYFIRVVNSSVVLFYL
jgi:hypothetical protein